MFDNVGSTTNPFRYCWNNFMDNNSKTERGVEHMQADLCELFASYWHNGFLKDCTMTLITTIADPTRREEYWKKVLKTVKPYLCLEVLYFCPSFIHFSEGRVLVTLSV